MRAISLFAGVLMARWRRCNLALSIIGTQIHGCVSPTPDRQGSTFLCLSAAQPEPEVLTLVGHSRLKFAPGSGPSPEPADLTLSRPSGAHIRPKSGALSATSARDLILTFLDLFSFPKAS